MTGESSRGIVVDASFRGAQHDDARGRSAGGLGFEELAYESVPSDIADLDVRLYPPPFVRCGGNLLPFCLNIKCRQNGRADVRWLWRSVQASSLLPPPPHQP